MIGRVLDHGWALSPRRAGARGLTASGFQELLLATSRGIANFRELGIAAQTGQQWILLDRRIRAVIPIDCAFEHGERGTRPAAVCQMPRSEVICFAILDRKSTRLNSSHLGISYAVFCLKKTAARRR